MGERLLLSDLGIPTCWRERRHLVVSGSALYESTACLALDLALSERR